MDAVEKAEDAIKRWAEPDEELGWPGAPDVATHAHEIAGILFSENLLSPYADDPKPVEGGYDRERDAFWIKGQWVPANVIEKDDRKAGF